MPRSMTRRQWLYQTGAVTAGLTLGRMAARADSIMASPLPPADGEVRARLSSNENPYGPSERARRAILDAMSEGCRYPGQQYRKLEELIAKKEGLTPEHVVISAGSGEILRMTAMAYGLQGGELMTAHPTYEGMEGAARTINAFVHRVPLNEKLEHDLDAMDRQLTQAIRLVFVCNPNNPTGTIVAGDRLRTFCKEASRRSVVLVDEAYYEYVEAPEYASMLDLVRQGHNVIVSRTFSKIHGLAGLRVGYGLARPDIAARLRPFRSSLSVNMLGVHAAIASYQDTEFQDFSRRKNAEARSYLCRVLDEMGLRCAPSHTNFVFFRLGRDVQPFREAMQKRGILLGRLFPPYTDWCRVSTGTMDELKIFAAALRELANENAGNQ